MALRKRDFQPAAYADGRKVMPIEQALAWAYQTELCSASETQLYGNGWNMDRVDCSTSSAWLAIADAAAARAVSPDALAIHETVRRLGTENWLGVDCDVVSLLLSESERELSEMAGNQIARAEAFMKALQEPGPVNLVITHARLGSVPFPPERPDLFATRNPANGSVAVKQAVDRREKTIDGGEATFSALTEVKMVRAKLYPQTSQCLITYYPSWESVVRDRAEYLVLWLAWEWIITNLPELDRMVLTMTELPQRPWNLLDYPFSS